MKWEVTEVGELADQLARDQDPVGSDLEDLETRVDELEAVVAGLINKSWETMDRRLEAVRSGLNERVKRLENDRDCLMGDLEEKFAIIERKMDQKMERPPVGQFPIWPPTAGPLRWEGDRCPWIEDGHRAVWVGDPSLQFMSWGHHCQHCGKFGVRELVCIYCGFSYWG